MAYISGFAWMPWDLINQFALMTSGIILACIVVTPFFLGCYYLARKFLK